MVVGLSAGLLTATAPAAHAASGASLPFTSVEAESATTTGTKIGPDPNRNLAKGRPATATGSQDVYTPGKAVDGDANSYWESANNAFPQSWTVDLGSSQAVRRLVLKLPPSSAWGARTQTVTVLGSTDGSTYSTVVGSTGYRFDPATGNTASVSLPGDTGLRYLRLSVSANTGWPAGQFSEVEAYPTS